MISLVRDLSTLQFNWHLQLFSLVLKSFPMLQWIVPLIPSGLAQTCVCLWATLGSSRLLLTPLHYPAFSVSFRAPYIICWIQYFLLIYFSVIQLPILQSSFIHLELPSQISAIREISQNFMVHRISVLSLLWPGKQFYLELWGPMIFCTINVSFLSKILFCSFYPTSITAPAQSLSDSLVNSIPLFHILQFPKCNRSVFAQN